MTSLYHYILWFFLRFWDINSGKYVWIYVKLLVAEVQDDLLNFSARYHLFFHTIMFDATWCYSRVDFNSTVHFRCDNQSDYNSYIYIVLFFFLKNLKAFLIFCYLFFFHRFCQIFMQNTNIHVVICLDIKT